MRWQGRALRGEDGGPPDRAQRNFTDPDSRILPTRNGFVQGYNGQIAVDAAHQVIVAHRLVTTSADYRALIPLVDSIHTCTLCKCLVGTRCKLARRASSLGATSVHPVP